MSRMIAVNEKGRRIGQDHHQAKSTDNDIELIFQLRELGLSLRQIGDKLNLSHTQVHNILSGKHRAQIPDHYVHA